jgi:hypothetical protein
LTLTNVQLTNDGTYTVVASNSIGVTVSSNAVLAVGYAPAITNQPENQQVVQGTNVTFTVGASGTGPLGFQWYLNGTAVAQGTNSNLALTDVQATNAGGYSVVVSSPFGSVVSSNAVLTVDAPPLILTQPGSRTVTIPSGAIVSIDLTGYPPPAFQWSFNSANIPGATAGGLTITNVAPGDGGGYTVVASNAFGSVTSSVAVLLVNYLTATRENQAEQLATTNLTFPSTIQPGNTFAVSSVAVVSGQGGSVQLTNGIITYTPPADFTGEDVFDYVLTPASGPASTETVSVLVDASLALGASVNGGQATIQFKGIPEVNYNIEASSDLQIWTSIGRVVAGPDGGFEIVDANAGLYNHRYYRTSLP